MSAPKRDRRDRDAPEGAARQAPADQEQAPPAGQEEAPEPPAPDAPAAAGAGREGADSAEPAGDQDPEVEAERTRETDRLRAVDPARDEALGEREEEPAASDGQASADAIERVEAERDEYLALAQRTQAEFDNYRKRAAREVATAGARAKAELVRALLPVVDNLERALESAGDDEASLAEGVRLVHAELVQALERSGLSSIDAAGQRFDPNVHEALSTRAGNGADAGTVLDVVQKGYRLDETVLRPARVVVAA